MASRKIQEQLSKSARKAAAPKPATAEAPSRPAEAPAEPAKGTKARTDPGPSEAAQALLNAVRDGGLTAEERKSFWKVQGKEKRRLYVLKRGARADLSGFSVKHAAVEQLSEAEAIKRHLGGVRGIVDLTRLDTKLVAAILAELKA